MPKLAPLSVAAAVLLAVPAVAQAPSATPPATHSSIPVDISVAKPPSPVTAEGRTRLLYELRLTNFYPGSLELVSLDVLGDGDCPPLATFRDAALDPTLMMVGAGQDPGPPRTLAGGRSAVVFLDLALPPGAATPHRLRHALAFRIRRPDGSVLERSLTTEATPVGPPALIVASPLRGKGWLAANGLAARDHRRVFNAVDGHAYLAQRFAIDWVQLGPDGRLFRGDPKSNASYPGYGADVLAVADARVSAIVDSLPDNLGNNPASSRTITLENVTGNAIVLDLGGGRFAVYGHLQPGSLRVKVGDRVKTGQALARLGNSGNSDLPHLHFHVVDANSPLGAEGVPFAMSSFTQEGVVTQATEVLEKGEPWRAPADAKPARYRDSFPVDNAVVDFP